MNNVIINNLILPQVLEGGYYVASNPFYHVRRTANFHVMIFVTEGCIYVTEENKDYEIKSGQILFLKAGINHFGKYEIKKGTKWYYVHFLLEQKELKSDSQNQLIVPKKMNEMNGTFIEEKISQLIQNLHSNNQTKKWNCNLEMLEILKELCFFQNQLKPQKITLASKISAYLESLDCEEFNAQKVSDYFCLSYKHLAATFKKEKNISMQHFHQKIRIDKACKLLRTTLLSIWEIANQTGWNDQLYFSRCFKNTMGMSPTEYRNLPLTY